MGINDWVSIIVSVLAGLATAIPLVIKLVQTIQTAVKEKNWSNVMQIVLKLMTEAENNYSTGAERKEYVMDSIEAIKDSLNCEIDMDVISNMIDSICQASRVINAEAKEE